MDASSVQLGGCPRPLAFEGSCERLAHFLARAGRSRPSRTFSYASKAWDQKRSVEMRSSCSSAASLTEDVHCYGSDGGAAEARSLSESEGLGGLELRLCTLGVAMELRGQFPRGKSVQILTLTMHDTTTGSEKLLSFFVYCHVSLVPEEC